MTSAAIEIRSLRKSYGPVEAVRGIDLTVSEGEVFGLLGPNGAGKTTTVEIVEGFRRRDAGTVSVLGMDPAKGDRKLKQQIGIVLQSTGMDPYLTVSETIDMFRSYYPAPRSRDEVIQLVGLADKRDALVTKLSGGQHRRLDVAIALAGDPRLLFLDEPTTGFDPGARRSAWDVIKTLAALGKTIFLTSHAMDEVEFLCDRVAVISDGRIVAEGSPSTLAGRQNASTVIRFQLPPGGPQLPDHLLKLATVNRDSIEIRTDDATPTLYELTSWAVHQHISLAGLEVARPSLEDVYLTITHDVAVDGGEG